MARVHLLHDAVDLGIDLVNALETNPSASILLFGNELLDDVLILVVLVLLPGLGRLVFLLFLTDRLLFVNQFLESIVGRAGLSRTGAVEFGAAGILSRVSV